MQDEMKNWTASDIPSKNDGLAVIAGSAEGIGHEDALALSIAGWDVILIGRNIQKGAESIAKSGQLSF